MSRWKSCFLLLWLLALPCAAETPVQPENRFLFVINTSAGMRYATNGIRDAVVGLIKSGMQGQMRDGDTFGVWTYNDALHTDFPMNVWAKAHKDEIADSVAGFLAKTRFEKRPHLDKVLPQLRPIIAGSSVITIIFIYDGSETMQGMEFDKDINDLQKEFGRQVRADNVPFVTALAAHDGKVFDYRVRTPSSISLPETTNFFKPAETNVVAAVAPKPVITPTPAPTPPPTIAPKPPETHRPEIVFKATEPPKTNATIAVVPAGAEKVHTAIVTNSSSVQPSESETHPKPDPAVVAVTTPPANTVAAPPIPTPKPELPPKSEPARVVAPTPPISSPVASPPSRSPEDVKPMAYTAPPPVAVPSSGPSATAVIATSSNAKAESAPVSPTKPAPVVESQVKTAPGPITESPKAVTTVQTPAQPAAVTVPVVAALPAPSDHVLLLVIAFSLVTIAAVLVIFLFRRSRTPPSLISQSMDRSH